MNNPPNNGKDERRSGRARGERAKEIAGKASYAPKNRLSRSASSVPPKVTAPRPASIFPRERLFNLLDRTREHHAVIWISAPGGAGKTSLAASYLSARGLPVLWYQVDAGDGDVASFFYYMGLATAHAAPRHGRPLPVLTPEYLADLPTFTRNYFRELYGRLPESSVIVLDNCQEAPESSPLNEVLQIAMSEVPDGLNLVVLSRIEPPAALARLRLSDRVACLDWSQMQLTPEETAGISAIRVGEGALDHDTLSRVHDRAHGWAAGLVLLLEQGRAGRSLDPAETLAGQSLLFDYFAGELLARAEATEQSFLVETALFPKVTANAARELTGIGRAREILEEMTRRNYFTVRHAGSPEDTYEYHPLFREFLLKQAERRYGRAELDALRTRAADLLEWSGDVETAVTLRQQAGDWEAAARLITTHAPTLLAQGRAQLLLQWLHATPPVIRERSPWLLYWEGVSTLGAEPRSSQATLSRALSLFEAAGDTAGIYLSLAGLFEAIWCAQSDFTQFDPLFEKFVALTAQHPEAPSRDIEVRLFAGLIRALFYRCPDHPQERVLFARAMDLWECTTDANLRIQLGISISFQVSWHGEIQKMGALHETHEYLRRHAALEPLCEIALFLMGAFVHCFRGDHAQSLADVESGLALAKRVGVRVVDPLLLAVGCYDTLTVGALAEADAYLDRLGEITAIPGRDLDTSHYLFLRSWRSMLGGDTVASHEAARAAVEIAERVGATYPIALCRCALAHTLTALGRDDEAMRELSRARGSSLAPSTPLIQFYCDVLEAVHLLGRQRRDEGLQRLREGLRRSREMGVPHPLYYRPELMTAFYAAALDHDVDVTYVQDCIRGSWLIPDQLPLHLDAWPFPVKIYTLGRFRILVDGEPLAFAGKAQKKPMELLKALVAFGGSDVREDRLAEALWPDADGDAATQVLATTLHRLRRLIGDDAIERREGYLSLDRQRCYVDLWALERQFIQVEQACERNESERLLPLTAKLLQLYRGTFLADSSDLLWVIGTREKLRNRFLRHLQGAARALEQAKRYDEARQCYEKGLDVDFLAEPFYQGLMRSYLAQSRYAEARSVYERCKKLLASELGLRPSDETEALAQKTTVR